jgi:hypothetical protein
MCMLCGALGVGRHWAEKDRDAPALRRERRVRIRLLNRVLGHYGMAAKLWGSGYMLGRSGGASQRADNLGGVWLEAERASGRRCDPLDPALVAALGGGDAAPS